MITIEVQCGSHINGACQDALSIFNDVDNVDPVTGEREPVTFEFNGTPVTTQEGDTVETMYARWNAEITRKSEEYRNSQEYKDQQAAYAEKERLAALATAKMEASAVAEFTKSNQEAWDADYNANKNDGYGAAALSFANRFARFLETKINEGLAVGKTVRQVLEESGNEMSHVADVEGITGFMYGCAVGCLVRCWKYGEDLRKWHNKEYGVNEDAKGVVNPAILTIDTGDSDDDDIDDDDEDETESDSVAEAGV